MIYVPFGENVVFLNVVGIDLRYQALLREIAQSLRYRSQADSKMDRNEPSSRLYFEPSEDSERVEDATDRSASVVDFILPFSGVALITQTGDGGPSHYCNGSDTDCQALDFDTTGINGMDGRIFAVEDGTVRWFGWDSTGGYGNLVKILHSNGMVSWYAHLSSFATDYTPTSVIKGMWMGNEGRTGCDVTYNCGSHLHFMIKQGEGNNYGGVDISNGLLPGVELRSVCQGLDCGSAYGGPSLYKGENLTGISQVFGDNDNSLNDEMVGDHETRSIRVPQDWVVITYSGENYTGFQEEYDGPFTGNTHLGVASLKVAFRACPARVINDSPDTAADVCGGGTDDTTPPSASGFNVSVINGRTADITTSGVQDNSGGSGVSEVRFSAKWGGSWKGIGTDSSAPYTLSWDMCSSGVPTGDVELGMEVRDNADNVWIWSEHNGNPHITMDSACGGDGNPQPGGTWHANFWMNKYLAGYVNWDVYYVWDDGNWPYIWFDWGTNGPKEGWSGDEFSLRIWRDVYFPGGRYEFRTDADDGHRVYVDGQLVIDHWWSGSAGGGKDISQGTHEVKVEYFENTGDAKLSVMWYGPGYPQPDLESPGGRITSPSHQSGIKSSPFTVWAEAWDDVSGVDYVDLWAHYCIGAECTWRKVGTDGDAPYAINWDWATIAEQHVWLALDVFDQTGKMTGSAGGWVEVDLDKTNPSAQIDSPEDFSYLTGNAIPIAASAADGGSGIGAVQFFAGYDDGSGNYWHELGFDTDGGNGWQWTWDAAGAADQRDVALFIYAYDRAGNYFGAARWANILDRTPPTSQVAPLPSSRPHTINVVWAGADSTAGLASFDVQFSKDGGGWQDWMVATTSASSWFVGELGHSYSFRSRATDLAGHVEGWPAAPDASTTVDSLWPTSDVFWYAPGTAGDSIFLFNGNGTHRSISRPVNGTYTPLIGDFNGDGLTDVFWYAPGLAADSVFLSNGDGTFRSIPQKVNGWYTPLVGDFNGDLVTDIFWYAPGVGADSLFLANWDGTFHSVPQRVNGNYTPLVGDFNGDTADDIFWYAPGTAADSLFLANGDGTFRSVAQKVNGTSYKPLVGDFNGDGADDIFWYGPGAYVGDSLFLANGDGTFRGVAQKINGAAYKPLVGDFDGDDKADIFWYAPGLTGDSLFLANGDGTFRAVAQSINGSYTPLVGDFNGDAAADIFWYAPGTAGDSLFLANGDGTFHSVGKTINGTYTPLVGSFD